MFSRRSKLSFWLVSLCAVASWTASVARAALEPPPATKGPVVTDYGPVFEVAAPDFETPREHDYKAVFDVASAPPETDRVHPSIETVARFLNMHANAGVPRSRLHAALVLHGNAGKYALSHAAYRERFGTDNPSLKLIEELRAAGVRVILCGQTAASRGFERDALAEPVELALSAMTALVVLQQEGYALIAF